MIGFDIASLSSTLVSTKQLERVERFVVIERMIETAVFAINNPNSYDGQIDRLVEVLELEYGIVNPAAIICDYRDHIEKEIVRHCWDARLKIKMDIKKIGRTSCKVFVAMDLEETFYSLNFEESSKEAIGNVISDTPTLEQLNELIPVSKKRATRTTKVLPDLKSRFVGDPTDRSK